MSTDEALTVPTPDGRTLEVLTFGEPGGFPLLYHSGHPSAAVHDPLIDRAARANGLRVVTYSRPGYGSSTPRPAPYYVADDIQDSAEILRHLGIEDFVTLGWSGGGPRALGCAALMAAHCRAAATLAGVAPYDADGLDWFAGMAPENVEEYTAAAAGREAYQVWCERETPDFFAASPRTSRRRSARW
ncbi:alpha/beta fold hydrolase [Nocardioides mesophilus]|uniref:alpha/beta fold hydrolase n=1 Tax=Nocardioides mesophilus TaxID=433659 RepID=UPI001FE520D2|nr:alpha/beta hydrolase [Nocardioides mesophilus]